MVKLDHISVSSSQNGSADFSGYRVRAELKGIPGKQWQDGLRFVWFNSPFYLCNKSELNIEGSEVELLLKNSNDIQNAVDSLSHCITKAGKMVRSTGITYISNYRRVH